MKLILVRHGETEANKEEVYSGWTDYNLTPKGEKQIRKVAKKLKNESIDEIYSSPMDRTLKTAKVIAEELNQDIKISEELKEMNFGIFEGKTHEEISTEHKKDYESWTSDYVNYRIPKGECLQDLYDRLQIFINNIKNTDKTFLLVTHGGIIQCLITMLLGMDFKNIWRFKTSPAVIVHLEYKDDFGFITKLLNIEDI